MLSKYTGPNATGRTAERILDIDVKNKNENYGCVRTHHLSSVLVY